MPTALGAIPQMPLPYFPNILAPGESARGSRFTKKGPRPFRSGLRNWCHRTEPYLITRVGELPGTPVRMLCPHPGRPRPSPQPGGRHRVAQEGTIAGGKVGSVSVERSPSPRRPLSLWTIDDDENEPAPLESKRVYIGGAQPSVTHREIAMTESDPTNKNERKQTRPHKGLRIDWSAVPWKLILVLVVLGLGLTLYIFNYTPTYVWRQP